MQNIEDLKKGLEDINKEEKQQASLHCLLEEQKNLLEVAEILQKSYQKVETTDAASTEYLQKK